MNELIISLDELKESEGSKKELTPTLNSIPDERYESFKTNHKDRTAICMGYAVAVAALLSDNGYPPLILILDPYKKDTGHALFLYNQEGMFSTLGAYTTIKRHLSVSGLVNEYRAKYGKDIRSFFILNLDVDHGKDWISGDKPLMLKDIDENSLYNVFKN